MRSNFGFSTLAVAVLLLAGDGPSRAAQPDQIQQEARDPGAGGWRHEELRRFKAAEARQGVAVDAEFFYAIDNHAIGKYRKATGERVGGWDGGKDGRIKHLNSGVVIDGRLHVAHSNFPRMPEESSIEVWDAATMQPVESHRFAQPPGSLTWALPTDGGWLACFAHYKSTSDPARSRVIRFDKEWKPLENWSFPDALIRRFAGSSASGGGFGPGGGLFVTGHDAKELYLLGLPESGSTLQWRATIPIGAEGQAFCWDPVEPGKLYSISRRSREVIVSRVFRDPSEPRPEVLDGEVAGTTDNADKATPPAFEAATSEGAFPLHLQGVATDGRSAIFWSWSDALVKTDLQGRLLKQVKAPNHQGDLCVTGGKVYVAVNLGKFNRPAGEADSWVYIYDAETLDLLTRERLPEVVHGAGGIAHRDGKFLVVGGLPPGVEENYLYEYDAGFRFVKRHVLASGYTLMGIQTAIWGDGSWWFGCYGKPAVLLRADADFRLTGRWEFDASTGLEALPDGRFLIGKNSKTPGAGYVGRVLTAREDVGKGLVIENP